MQFNERNIKLLSELQPELWKNFNTPSKLTFPDVNIGFGQNENNVVDNVVIKIGEMIYVDSKGADAEQFMSLVNPKMHTVIVLGLGLGYHVEKFIETYPDKKIIVIEPDKRILSHAMHLKDFESIFKHATLWVDEEIDLVRMKIYEMITHPLARGIQVIPYISLYPNYAGDFFKGMQKMMTDWAVSVNTKRTLVDKWYTNRFANIKKPAASAKVFIDKYKDIPAILVGAGPSLQSQLETLKSLQNKAVIIAASTAVEILNSHGIKPTFAIAIDQDPITSGGLHENLDSDVPLLFDGQVAQNSLSYKGPKYRFCLNVNRYDPIVVPDIPVLESGPSVANVALDFLHKAGCSPILIVGMDLSYTNNKLYCDGTQFNQDVPQTGLMLTNNKGESCSTEPSFLSMKHWFEEYAKRSKPDVYNCTERGLIIDNIPNADLNDMVKDFTKEYDFNVEEPVDTIDYESINKNLITELQDMKSAIKTGQVNQYKSWVLVEEFVQSLIYLEEIRCEDRIKNGMDKGESINIFQNNRQEVISKAIDDLINLLNC